MNRIRISENLSVVGTFRWGQTEVQVLYEKLNSPLLEEDGCVHLKPKFKVFHGNFALLFLDGWVGEEDFILNLLNSV